MCECTGLCESLTLDYDHNMNHQYIIIHTSMSLDPEFLIAKEIELRAMVWILLFGGPVCIKK